MNKISLNPKRVIKFFLPLIILLCSFFFVSGALTDNLIRSYSGDYTNVDDTGNANMSLYSGATYTTGKIGTGAFDLDGINDFMVAGYTNINFYTNYTFSIWFNIKEKSDQDYIWRISAVSGNFQIESHYNEGADSLYSNFQKANEGNTNAIAYGFDEDTWYHYVSVWENRSISIYINGKLNVSVNNKKTGVGDTYSYILMGKHPLNVSYANMSFDQFMFWNRAINESEIDELYNNGTGYNPYYIPSTSSPIITLFNPSNNTQSNIVPEISFKVVDDDNGSLPCLLYIDNVLNQTNASTLNDTITNFTFTSFPTGSHYWEIKCDDVDNPEVESGKFRYYYDPDEPFIQIRLPVPFNTTVYSGYSMNIVGNVTNLNLTNVTIKIYYPNSSLFLDYENTSFSDPIFFAFDWTFNTTLEPNGFWTMDIYALDSIPNINTAEIMFEVDNCVPNHICSGYELCNISDKANCNATLDMNGCGLPYTGNYSEFDIQTCNYCSYNLVELFRGSCHTNIQPVLYNDSNFYTCCNVTGLPSDCRFGAFSFGTINESCQRFYTKDDIAPATIDLLLILLLTFGVFLPLATTIWVILRMYKVVKNKKK